MPFENYLQYAKTCLGHIGDYLYEHSLIIGVIAGIVLACVVAFWISRTYLRRRGHMAVRAIVLAAQSEPAVAVTDDEFIGPLTPKDKIRRLLARAEAERSRTQGGHVLTEMAFMDDADAAERGVVQLDPYSPRAHELADEARRILTAALPKAEGRMVLVARGMFVEEEARPLREIKHKPEPPKPPVGLELSFWYCLFTRQPRWTDFDYRFAALAFLLNVLELLEYKAWEHYHAATLKKLFDEEQEKCKKLAEQARAELLAQNAELGIRPEKARPLTTLEKLELERRRVGLPSQAASVTLRGYRPPPPVEQKWPLLSWLIPVPAQERRQVGCDIN